MYIPNELIEQFARGNGVVFVGEDLSIGAGLPSKSDLKNSLARELIGYPQDSTYEDIVRYHENEFGRNRLVTRLREELDTSHLEATLVHQNLMRLPINRIFTTNYDDFLEKSARARKRKYNLVVKDVDVFFPDNDTLDIIKLYGDLTIPDSIIVSRDYDFYFAKRTALTTLLFVTLKRSTVLFLGFSSNDINLQRLLAQVRDEGGVFARNLYSVQFGAQLLVIKDMEQRGLKVIDLGPQQNTEAQNAALARWLRLLNEKVREYNANHSSTPVVPILRDSQISTEVKALLRTMGFKIVRETWEDENPIFQARRMTMGEDISRWFLCQESPVTKEDISRLHEEIETDPGSRGWIVTLFKFSDDDKTTKMLDQYPSISVCTLAAFYQQMLAYDKYLEEVIREAAEIEKYWVDLECGIENKNRINIIEYVDAWINSSARNHLALLGDFGTGKTWFCSYYAARLARRHLRSPENHRIPILIPLQGYAKALNIEPLITDTLVNSYHIDLVGGFETFMHLNRSGRLLLIFDGFDEMERRIDDSVALQNYEDILRTVVDNSKVILTSRPVFFKGKEYLSTLLRSTRDRPNFETLSTQVLKDDQIQAILRKLLPNRTQWEECWKQITSIRRLRDLASRPVMVQIISRTLPAALYEGPSHINGAVLYRIYVNEWIEKACRKDKSLLKRKEEVLSFLHDLSWDMYCTQGTGTIAPSKIQEAAEKRFGKSGITSGLANLFVVDKTTANYTFPHISFMEYFVADKVIKHLCVGDIQYLFACHFTNGAVEFLVDLASNSEAQTGILNALFAAQNDEQVDLVVKLLMGVGRGNPVKLVLEILALDHYTTSRLSQRGPAPSAKDELLDKVISYLATGLPDRVVAALGKEEFLNEISIPLQDMTSHMRHFIYELLGSPAVSSDRALNELRQAMYADPDVEVRLHVIQVLGKRRGKRGSQTLIEAIGSQEIPIKIRQACIDNLLASTLSSSSIRTKVLKMLHGVINNDQDEIGFRGDCVIWLARYNSREALEPLIPILKDFNHKLWYVSATAIHRTNVLSIADEIEREIITPNQTRLDLIREVFYLKAAVNTIKANVYAS